jgi:hypothetical protein
LTSHTARGVLVKPKLTKNKMGFNEDATTLTDKKQICNFKHTEETKTRYQVKNKKILAALKTSKIKQKQNNSKDFFPF